MAHKTRKDRRKEYTGVKRFDKSCRCHGSCGYCVNTRTYFDQKHRQAADMDLKEVLFKIRHRALDNGIKLLSIDEILERE